MWKTACTISTSDQQPSSSGPESAAQMQALKALLTDLTVLAFLFAGQCALAQDMGSIRGKVTDTSGAPILGAVVTVKDIDGNSRMTVTGSDGAFQISSLTLGT